MDRAMMRTAQARHCSVKGADRRFETSPNCENGEVSIVPMKVGTGPKLSVSQAGTAHANNNYNIGGPVHFTHNARGGARNRSDRVSHGLNEKQVANLAAAASHASMIGLPFTRMITIHWQAAGVPLCSMAKATGRFIDLMTKALARHCSATAWIWVHESGERKGGHCHLLAHVPARLVKVLVKLQRGWLKRITGKPYQARLIRSRPVGGWLDLENCNPNLHAQNLHVAVAYVLKQATAEALARFQLERWEPGGLVIGKRCGTSQNIGPSARKRQDR